MATLPRSYIDAYTRALNMLSDAAQAVVRAQLEAITYTDAADLREQVIGMLEPLLSKATDNAAAYSANNYDAVREFSVGEAMNAEAHSGRISEATEGAVRALMDRFVKHGFESFENAILERCDYEIKRAAGECSLYNAERDVLKPRFARVPAGAETCNFCIMLASRGFVYHSESTAGLNHYHPNCDCRIVQGYEGMEIEGYDPDELYRQWKDGESNNKNTEELSDIQIGKSLSAAAFRDQVKIPKKLTGFDHDIFVKIAEGSKIEHVTPIAGRGTSVKIHSELDSLQEQFPDVPRNDWTKCAGNAVVEDMGLERKCHVHWYQDSKDMRVRMRVIKWLS